MTREEELKELLNKHHDWPATYNFKFIYKADESTESSLKELFPIQSEITIKTSKKKNFNSMNVHHLASNSKEVLDIYDKASKIEGVISL